MIHPQLLMRILQMYQQQQAANPGAQPAPRPEPMAGMPSDPMARGAPGELEIPAPQNPATPQAPTDSPMTRAGMMAAGALQQAGDYITNRNAPNVVMEQNLALQNQGFDARRKQLLLDALQQSQRNGRAY